MNERKQDDAPQRIDPDDHAQLQYWLTSLAVMEAQLKAAVQAVRGQAPACVVVAVPVGAAETCQQLAKLADEVVCARTPTPFSAVGEWYRDFAQTTDDEVKTLLRSADT